MFLSFVKSYPLKSRKSHFFFIELLDTLLKNKGKAGYITPDTWISIPQAQKLRKHVLDIYGIDNIVAFSYSVFDDASVNAIIFILGKNNFVEKCRILHVDDKCRELSISSSSIKENIINDWKVTDDNQFQIWQNETDISIIAKIAIQSELGIDHLDVSQGIVPYSTEHLTKEQIKARIYHNKNKQEGKEWGEWIQGRALNRYCVNNSKNEFLKYGNWLHRPRKPKFFTGKRILIQEITGGTPPRITASLYSGILYHDPGIISCLNISNLSNEFLLAIINSKLISWYNLKTSPKGKRTTFPKVLIGDIRKFPIKNINNEEQQPFIDKADKMLELNRLLQDKKGKFLNRVRANFEFEKITKKLESFYDFDFKTFAEELKKQKINFSLLQQDEWEEYFTAYKNEINQLQAEITATDKAIDQMVYELYGLTADEINIVEKQ